MYIHPRVPLINQGGVFGMQLVVYNALTIVAMLGLSLITTTLGSRIVFIIAPLAVFGLAVWLLRFSPGIGGERRESRRKAIAQLWNEPG